MYLLSDTIRQVLIGLTAAGVQISSELDVCEMSSDINNLSIYKEKASSVQILTANTVPTYSRASFG